MEIERLRRDLMAMREKNGVYLAHENYQDMINTMESQAQEITERIGHIRALEGEIDKKTVRIYLFISLCSLKCFGVKLVHCINLGFSSIFVGFEFVIDISCVWQEMFLDTNRQLEDTCEKLRETKSRLDSTQNTLTCTQKLLHDTAQERDEQKYVM